MSGYVKWEDVKALVDLIAEQTSYWEGSRSWNEANDRLKIKMHELENSAIDLQENKNYNITINLHNNTDEKSAREFADELAKQIRLKELF